MDMQVDTLSFLDLLDLDEAVIDTRLKTIMVKSNHTNKHLINAIQLLQYKNLINTQEDSDCDNDDEFDFSVQLLSKLSSDNVDYICKIIYVVLCLNNTSIVNKSEHLIQQVLLDIDLTEDKSDRTAEVETYTKTHLDLKICESILDAIIQKDEKLSLLFLETPLEDILDFTNEKLKVYFLTSLVPKLFKGVTGYNILDRIWSHIVQLKGDKKQNALKILSCLSNYYLPIPDVKNKMIYLSEIIHRWEFWDIILYGLMLDDSALRKISVYLLKRAIDCVIASNKDIYIHNETHTIFQWIKSNAKHFKIMWDNYFILLDSLEEKQSNIVLPSLNLFETINIGECWLNAAFNIGLKHDNTQIKLKCVEYRLKHKIQNELDAVVILEVFNNTNIYGDTNFGALKTEFTNLLRDQETLLQILKAIPIVKWSPVPFYYVTDILACLKYRIPHDLGDLVLSILKVSCTNVAIRKAAYHNIAIFINNCLQNLNWKDIINFYSIIQIHTQTEFILEAFLKQIKLKEEERHNFLNTLSKNALNIDMIIFYISQNEENFNLFIDILNEKIMHINDIVNRRYSNKSECIEDVIFIIHLLSKTQANNNEYVECINKLCTGQAKTLVSYILSIFSDDNYLSIENIGHLFNKHNYKFEESSLVDNLLELYKTSILFIMNASELELAVLGIFTLKILLKNYILRNEHYHKMLKLTDFLELVSDVQFQFPSIQNQSLGRWKNAFYEKSCEIIYLFMKDEDCFKKCIKQLIKYLENVLECGGYGCLKWILKIVNKIVKPLVDNEKEFNITQFINKVWNEIEELKSNNQYSPCIEEFVQLITHDALLEKAMYNNIVISYCNKIIEYGPIKTNPLYYLIRSLNQKCVTKYSHLVYILCDILLYSPIIRKDDRITNNVTLQILQDSTYGIDKNSVEIHFNFEIQYLAIKTLCSINDPETINIIIKFLTNKTDENFRNKQRYHGDSQPHKTLQLTLQHILMLSLKSSNNLDWLLNWSLDLLVKLPHQPSVRVCLEWIVALYFYVKKATINEEILKTLRTKKAPLTSQFFVLYWLLKHKISNNSFSDHEYDFVIDFLLSHTMGQLFNVRLHAQYFATALNKMIKKPTKFDYTISVIEKTFQDSYGDKNLAKLKVDYFANKFDLIANLNPYFIYYLLPKYCDSDGMEKVDGDFVKSTLKDIIENLVVDKEFKNEWVFAPSDMEEFVACEWRDKDKIIEDEAAMGTIQKKYIPWKNMSDINVYDSGKKVETSSDLIVVASLIDKLPNLGGMARTSEVFGVKTYVVDSLRHLQDKQFQGLSVSAERWINVEEVRPGRALKEYVLQKKSEGYSAVAAEQTSSSSQLQTFKFPKKTLLLLGHEKEGVPCDLLPIMDYCVEIPQQGYVRSLNVHVTAAIFIWEYARQNVLRLIN